MKSKHGITKAPLSPKRISASLTLVEKASQLFAGAPRLTATERKHKVKFRRGAHEIVPTIASLATKHGLVAPGHSIDAMNASIEQAQAIEPLLGAAAVLYETLRDQSLIHNADAWKTATATYAMLLAGANANVDIARELEPVKEWFAHRSPLSKKASAENAAAKKAKSKQATAPAPSSTDPATIVVVEPAPKANGALVNGVGAAHALS